jgi:hypothetical protein
MTNEIWLNLPVKDVSKSKEFFQQIGFALNEQNGCGDEMAGLRIGRNNFNVMLVAENPFRHFSKSEIADNKTSAQILISFDAESREAVDDLARKVFDAGGTIFSEPQEMQGWMYGFGFTDLDGHRWNQVFMDFSKMPQQA